MTLSCFVTGTDTGVGKTLVSCALLRWLGQRHAAVVGMKPVAAGATLRAGVWANDDVLALRAASTLAVAAELDNPYLLRDPLAPHLAARRWARASTLTSSPNATGAWPPRPMRLWWKARAGFACR